MTAPKTINVLTGAAKTMAVKLKYGHTTEYTRSDTIPAMLAAARAEGINEGLMEAAHVCRYTAFNDPDEVRQWRYIRRCILALIGTPAPEPVPEASLAKWKKQFDWTLSHAAGMTLSEEDVRELAGILHAIIDTPAPDQVQEAAKVLPSGKWCECGLPHETGGPCWECRALPGDAP